MQSPKFWAVISEMVIADAEISDSAVTSILEQFTVLIAPDRGKMITEPIVTEFNSQTQQGAPVLTEVPPAFAGMPPGSNSFLQVVSAVKVKGTLERAL